MSLTLMKKNYAPYVVYLYHGASVKDKPEMVQEVTTTVAEVTPCCDLCGFEGVCNGGASCQTYAMHKAELDEILAVIESDEAESKGELIEVFDLDFLLNNELIEHEIELD
ncbi:hypothetical protein ACJMK2_025008 [Sinanodonta woodiana]|uniref:Uncharacterized protein n=1 Tax=Sinanodonta woodiana TaxID=1069815 RepID=A0ABD3XF75_SINWO